MKIDLRLGDCLEILPTLMIEHPPDVVLREYYKYRELVRYSDEAVSFYQKETLA